MYIKPSTQASHTTWDVLDNPIWLPSPSSEEYGPPVRSVSPLPAPRAHLKHRRTPQMA